MVTALAAPETTGRFSLLVSTLPFTPGEIRIMPSSFCIPSPHQMMVSLVSGSRASFQGSMGVLASVTNFV